MSNLKLSQPGVLAGPDPNPKGGGGGVNYLTLRVQFYANECNEGETLTPNPKSAILR